ncbi:MAG: hypothetical protein A2X49_05645 [Lentisphaerae bacterium GWF2_52_8]|nr:MAG: hypothetical protein A2X49_05645 [Lentisphaerae bacterium GWF2_52_8]
MKKPVSIILDTDIGGDIDDTWALAMLLKSPELNPRLVVSTTANTVYRAKIIAKFLERNGGSEIPVGIGLKGESDGPRELQKGWVDEYSLEQYPGPLFEDGIAGMIEIIQKSNEELSLIAIGPMTNIAEMIRRVPGITKNVNLVAMMGSINRHHDNAPGAIAEFNVVKDISAAQTVFAAKWKSITITPLDSCGSVKLKGDSYGKLVKSKKPLVKDLIENFRIWAKAGCFKADPEKETSILYDTVAIHLAYSKEFLEMQEMHLIVDNEGFTRHDPKGPLVNVALNWTDLDAYKDFLIKRLLGEN